MRAPDGWRILALEKVAEVQTGLSKSATRVGKFASLPYLRVANVQAGYFDLSEIKQIEVPMDAVDRYRVRSGDLLLTEGGDFDKLGRGALWSGQIQDCVHQNHVFVVRASRIILDPRFLAYQTQGPFGRAYFLSCAKQSTNLASINSTQLKQFPTLLPPIPEQRKIADILCTWDEALTQLDALIAAKERLKNGLMQQLLTGRKRLVGYDKSGGARASDHFGSYPVDWVRTTLGTITEEVSTQCGGNTDFPVLSCTKYDGLVPSEAYFGKRVYASDVSKYKVVQRSEFAYATNHIEEGSIGHQVDFDAGLVSPIYTVFRTPGEVDDRFLFRLLKSPLLIHLYRINTSVSVDRRGSLRYEEFAKIYIWLPSKAEQLAIADVLDTSDRELRLLRRQRDTIERQKRGLMEQLLNGRIRVKTS
jgi:type I restriction enzyme S subunit